MKKYVELKPIVLREYNMIAEKFEDRINELQESGYKVLSISFAGFTNVAAIMYRKTVYKSFIDWLTKPLDHWSI